MAGSGTTIAGSSVPPTAANLPPALLAFLHRGHGLAGPECTTDLLLGYGCGLARPMRCHGHPFHSVAASSGWIWLPRGKIWCPRCRIQRPHCLRAPVPGYRHRLL
ncbi:hypothetical protein GUJ93_ZPchr0010g8170 [Zizania palustris]|uniref:Uncharacterized protein n=1 Tax=Zizania palustris TaxID=103762 RepID=A0A8J5TMD1_ZIZPA|nr:hypothetical protein GUJ93_ZPchr0010g8170 [Zizania palustris]